MWGSKSLRSRFEEKYIPEPNSGCWIWIGAAHDIGYGRIFIGRNDKGQVRLKPATHVSLELVGQPVPDGMQVCHKCDNPHCVNPDHLFIGTPTDNMQDCVRKGRSLRGTKNAQTKLTEKEVREIRASKDSERILGLRYGVSSSRAGRIRRKESWSWL